MTDPVKQKLMDLMQPRTVHGRAPNGERIDFDGPQTGETSPFAGGRDVGSNPHGGFDQNRGRGVGGPITAPVYGVIGEVGGPYGKIVIRETDATGAFTGYSFQLLHTQKQFVKPGDPVSPGDVVGMEGGVGAGWDKAARKPTLGPSHLHSQVYKGTDPTPLNPLRHLYEYHNPGQVIPPLDFLNPYSVPPKLRQPSLPSTTQQGGNPRASDLPNLLGNTLPPAVGPTSVGGPNGHTPLVPLSPINPSPIPDGALPRLQFAPSPPVNFGPFTPINYPGTTSGPSTESSPSPFSSDLPPTPGGFQPLPKYLSEIGPKPFREDLPPPKMDFGIAPGTQGLLPPVGLPSLGLDPPSPSSLKVKPQTIDPIAGFIGAFGFGSLQKLLASAIGNPALQSVLGSLFGSVLNLTGQPFNIFDVRVVGYGAPVILDLSGQGINITQLSSSNTWFDTAGDGYQHRTAWAAAGNGVLVYDTNGDGKITQANQINFTLWDPTAKSDMQALLDVFDTNQNGKLDAGDENFLKFKVLVTNADGTQTLRTLGELDIVSINLIESAASITLPDGSSIDGKTTFTRGDTTTGEAATVTLANDASGYKITQSVIHNGDGSTTIDIKALNPDGSLASETITRTSADGKSRTLTFDDDGDGVIDRIQTIVRSTEASGAIKETVSNYQGAGLPTAYLLDRTVTTTTSDASGKTVSVDRDIDGDGLVDQNEAQVTSASGALTDTITNYNPNGSVADQVTKALTSSGLIRTDSMDLDGNGIIDLIRTDVTEVDASQIRTETVSETSANGTLLGKTVTTTSANGANKTVAYDYDGDGVTDQISTLVITAGTNGSSVTTQKDTNNDGSLISASQTTISNNGLSTVTLIDSFGATDGSHNPVYDLQNSDVTVVNGDQSRTQTVSSYVYANGVPTKLLSRTEITKGADGITRTIKEDRNGALDAQNNPIWSSIETVMIDAAHNNDIVDTLKIFNPDGSLSSASVTTTSADGLSVATRTDLSGNVDANSNLIYDHVQTVVTTRNPDGSSAVVTRNIGGDGQTLIDTTTTTTSADGLIITTTSNIGGDNTITTDTTTISAGGARKRVIQIAAPGVGANPTPVLLSKIEIETSSDQKTTVTKDDANGDGTIDRLTVSYLQASGAMVDEVSIFAPDGSLISETRSVTSADGLATTKTTNIDGKIDNVTTYVTVLNIDGGNTKTVTRRANDGTLISQTVTTTSGDGFASTTTTSIDGKVDSTVTDVSSIATNGDTIETITNYDAQNAKISATRITTSANGLLQTTLVDENGDGIFDIQTVDQTTLNATDGSITELVTTTTVASSPVMLGRTRTVTSPDGLTVITSVDHTGSGVYDEVTTAVEDAAGNVVTTVDRYDPNNKKINETVAVERGNGLFKQVKVDVDGNGTFDQTQTDSIAFAQDGTQTETITTLAGTTTTGTTVITTNANGSAVTTQSYIGGTATTGRLVKTEQSQTSYNLDGTVTTTATVKGRNGVAFAQSATQTSADGKTTSITTNFLQSGFAANQTEAPESSLQTISELADGSVRDVTTYYASASAAGTILATKTVQTSANGLSKTLSWDLSGDSINDQTQSYAAEIEADGSTNTAFADAFTGAGFAMHVAVARSTSANGLAGTVTASVNLGASWSLIDGSSETFLNPDGSTSVVTKNNVSILRSGNNINYSLVYAGSDAAVVSTSRDGLTTTKQISTWGNNTFYRTDSFTTHLDGSTTQTITNLNDDNSLGEAKTVSVSADGRTVTMTVQTNEHGYSNYAVQTTASTNNGSGNAISVTTTVNYASNGGARRNTETTSTAFDGLSKITTLDTNADSLVDETKTDVTTLATDGRTIQTITETDASNTQIKKQVVTTSADGLHKTTTIAGSGAVLATTQTDTVDNADGSTTTTAITTSSGTGGSTLTRNTTVINTSADGRVTNVTWDLDGDQTLEAAESSVTHADGSKTVTDTYYQADGITVSSVTTTTTSANGLMTTVSRSIAANAASNTTEITLRSSDGSGSYTWTEKDASGNNLVHASHTIDQNGIDYVNLWVRGTEVTYRISADQEELDLAEVQSIYTVLLGRTMNPEETQTWLKYYTNSGLNVVQLAKDLMNSTEFWQDNDIAFRRDFGSQDRPNSSALLNAIYQNAFGRPPSVEEQNTFFTRVFGGNLEPMANFVVEIARIANPAGVPNARFNLQATSPYPLPFGAGGGGGGGVPDSIATFSSSYGTAVEHYDPLTGFLKRTEYFTGDLNYMTRYYDPLTGELSSEYGYSYDGNKVKNAYVAYGNKIDVYAGRYNQYNLFDNVNKGVQIVNNSNGTSTWTFWQQNLPQNLPLGTVTYFRGTSVDALKNPALLGHLSYSKIYDVNMGFYVEKSAPNDSTGTPLYNVLERTNTGTVLARGTDFAGRRGSDFTFYDPLNQLAPFFTNWAQIVQQFSIVRVAYTSTLPDGAGVMSNVSVTNSGGNEVTGIASQLNGLTIAYSPLYKMLPPDASGSPSVGLPVNSLYSFPAPPAAGPATGSPNSPTTPAGGFIFDPPTITLEPSVIDTQVGYVSGTGGDVFIYNAGYGAVEIDENDPSPTPQNVLKLGSTILQSSIRVTADSSGSLYITDGTTGDVIKLAGMLSDSSRGVQSVKFTSDDTIWTRAQLIQAGATGTTAADKLYGSTGAETFDGKGGNDYVSGNGGGDTIIYERGYGHLEIDQRDLSASSPSNVLRLDGINSTDVTLVSDGTNLYITDGRAGDRIKIDNMISDGMFGVQTIEFADTTWHWSDIQSRMKTAMVGSSGNDALNGTSGSDTVLYHGKASEYFISTNAAGVTTVADTVAGRDGTDTLTGIEHLQFADLTDAPPVAQNDFGSWDTGSVLTVGADQVLGNDGDADAGDTKTIVSVSALSARGAAVSFQNGQLSYDPTALRGTIPAGETVTDTFTYTMRDAAGATSTATVTMTVSEANHAPVAHDDAGFAYSNQVAHAPASFALDNDTDEDGGDTKTIVGVSALSAKGAAVSLLDGELYYDPRAAFAGLLVGQHSTDTFTYTMSDSAGARSTATVTMYIEGAGHAPVANNDAGPTINEEGTTTLLAADLLANDTDADAGDAKVLDSVSAISAKGAAVSIKDGNVFYDPRGAAVLQGLAAGESTTDTFTYTIRDAGGARSTATVTMTITGSNDGATPDGVFRIGTDFVVNTQTGGAQIAPKVTGLRDGGFVVTWVDDSQNPGYTPANNIKAQVFGANGDKIGAEFLVNTQTGDGQFAPAVTALANGGFVVTWEDNSGTLGDANGSSIKAQLFNAAGGKVGPELLVNSEVFHNQKAPEVAALPNGGFVISWQDFSAGTNNGTSYNIKAQVFAANGDKLGSELAVATQSANYRYSSSIVGLANGDFVVSWEDLSPGDGSSSGIRAQIFHLEGAQVIEVTEELIVNTEVTGGQNIPAVALADGGFVVAWQSGDASFGGIKGQIFNASGNKVGVEFLINTQTLNNQFRPAISALADGRFVVSWVDTSGTLGDSDGTSVKAQVFGANGVKIGSEFLVNTQTLGDQFAPQVAGLPDGKFVIAWERDDGVIFGVDEGGQPIHSDPNIRAQVFGLSLPRTINGTSGNDILVGGIGPDTLVGKGGNDTYRFDAIQTSEIVVNGSEASTGPLGTLQFTASNPDQLWFEREGNDLTIDVLGTERKVTVQNWYGPPQAQLGSIQANNLVLENNRVDALVQAMAEFASAHGGGAFNPATVASNITDTGVLAAVNNNWHQAV